MLILSVIFLIIVTPIIHSWLSKKIEIPTDRLKEFTDEVIKEFDRINVNSSQTIQ